MMIARCSCGAVEIEAHGAPITSAVCYCDTCQEGSRQIGALPNALAVCGADGGTAYVLYRKDRLAYSKGIDRLEGIKLDGTSTTSRVVATCCNSAMLVRFDDAKHWTPIYRERLGRDAPPVAWRICTKFAPDPARIPADVPSSGMYPAGFMWRLLSSRIAMLVGR